MKPLLITLYQGDYHLGAAALINSALRHGFDGRIALYHDSEKLPAWTSHLTADGPDKFRIGLVEIAFHRIVAPRHFGYHKPFVMREALRNYPDRGSIIYADPDVLFLAPWSFFESWILQGVAFCLDSQFPQLPAEHPWRATWRQLVKDATGLACRPVSNYPNSGFVALTRDQLPFLELWMALTEQFEKGGGDTKGFCLEERHRAIVGDQDLMAAALMAWTGPTSILGPEGMGFTEYFYALSHDINRPKAWRRDFAREAVQGIKPSQGSAFFLEYADQPIPALSPRELNAKKLSFKVARTISRFWKR